jgi:hypothetical protein
LENQVKCIDKLSNLSYNNSTTSAEGSAETVNHPVPPSGEKAARPLEKRVRAADNQPSEAAVVPSSPGFLVRFFPLLVPVYGRGKIRGGGVKK